MQMQMQNEYINQQQQQQPNFKYNQQKDQQYNNNIEYQRQQQLLLQQQQQQYLLQQQQQQQALLQAQQKKQGQMFQGGNIQGNSNFNQSQQINQGNQSQKQYSNQQQSPFGNFISDDPNLTALKLKDMLGLIKQEPVQQVQPTMQNDLNQGNRGGNKKNQKVPVKIDESEFPSLDQASKN